MDIMIGDFMVRKIVVIGTRIAYYSAWRPIDSILGSPCSTIPHIDGRGWFGRIGTDPDGALYGHLPVGEERFAAVERAYQDRFGVAYALIKQAMPETASGRERDGEIMIADE